MRKNMLIVLCLGILLLFSACKTKEVEDPVSGVMYHVNQMQANTQWGVLKYAMGVPDSFQQDAVYPLVLALHYGGSLDDAFGIEFLEVLIVPALGDLNAIMVAPICPQNDWTDPVSVGSVNALLDRVRELYKIDPSRIIVTGFSMGGVGTWHFAAQYPGIFAAAVPIASIPEQQDLDVVGGIPLYVIHGELDEVYPVGELQNAVNVLVNRGVSVQLKIISGLNHYTTGSYVPALQEAVPWIRSSW